MAFCSRGEVAYVCLKSREIHTAILIFTGGLTLDKYKDFVSSRIPVNL